MFGYYQLHFLHRNSRKNYIGSTYGKEGIWGRWKEYAKTGGHGNNVTLQKLYDQDNSYPNNFSFISTSILLFFK